MTTHERHPTSTTSVLSAAPIVALLLLASCGLAESEAVRAEAARNFACEKSDVEAVKIEEREHDLTRYRVEGCGRRAVYVCKSTIEPVGAHGVGYNSQERVVRCHSLDPL